MAMERQWPALPEPTPESLARWAAEITKLLRTGEIANGSTIDALDDLFLTPAEGNAAYVNVTGDTMTGALIVSRTAVNSTYIAAIATDDSASSGPQFTASRVSASPAANDLIGKFVFRGRDSSGADNDYAYILGRIDDPTNGSEDGSLLLGLSIGGATVEGELLMKASDAQIRAATAGPFAVAADRLESAAAGVALTDAATVAVNWDNAINFTLTVTANRIIGNPTNGQPGTWRTILVQGNDATDRVITFDTQYLGEVPTIIDADSGRKYLLMIYCVSASHFVVSAKRAQG